VELDEAGTAELVEAVLLGRLDAAFVRSPVGAVAGLRVEPVLEEPMLAALPEGHRLAVGDGPPLPLAELAGEPFVLYRRRSGPGLYDAVLAVCREAGFAPAIAQEAPRLPATLSLGSGFRLCRRRCGTSRWPVSRSGRWPIAPGCRRRSTSSSAGPGRPPPQCGSPP
jgi:DNA-binding transcriptional LysR family regulator